MDVTSEERGIIVGGKVVPGTERVVRSRAAWWGPGSYGTRPRAPRTELLCGHWTAGEAGGPGMASNHGVEVVRRMRGRRSPKTGQPLKVSVTFVIGAPMDPMDPGYAQIWQCADPALVACVHVGSGVVNSRSIGVEVVSAGMPGPMDGRKRPTTHVDLLGHHDRTVCQFYPAQLRSWLWLAEVFGGNDMGYGIQIPKVVPVGPDGKPLSATRRFTDAEARNFDGAMEHILVPGTTKVDAGGLLLGALLGAGWTPKVMESYR